MKNSFLEEMHGTAFELRAPWRPPLASELRNLKAKISAGQAVVATFYGLPCDLVVGPVLKQPAAWVRQVAMCLLFELTGATTNEIAAAFGKRTGSSVSHASDQVRSVASVYPEVRRELQELRVVLIKEIARL